MIYRFAGFELDPERFLLTRDGRSVDIEPRAFEVLHHLVAARGRAVSKDDLVAAVWAGRFVSDAAVARAVQKARRSLGDDGDASRLIETVHGRGYRVTGAVMTLDAIDGVATAGAPALITVPSTDSDDTSLSPRVDAVERLRPAAAVLPLRNLGPAVETDWIGVALAELLAVEIAADGSVRVVPLERIAELARDLPALSGGAELDRSALDAVRALLGADVVVAGSYLYTASGETMTLRANVEIRQVSSGAVAAILVEDDPRADLAALATRLSARLRPELGGEALVVEPRAWRLLPPDPAAARLYTEGVALHRRGESIAARPLLEQAAARVPGFALAHAALASTLRDQGYEEAARQASARARRLAATLPREQRLLVEGLHQECERDWPAAAMSYGALFRFFPDDLDYGLLTARAQLAAGSASAAQATVDAMRALSGPVRDDPRLDLVEAAVSSARSDPARARELAALAARKAQARGARRLEAQAWFEEGRALRYAGDSERANVSTRHGEELYALAGDRNGVATALQYRGATTFHLGDRQRAESLFRRALEIFTELGRRGAASRCRMNLGMLSQDRGDGATAARLYEEALEVFKELGDREFIGQVLMALVNVRYSQGNIEECLRLSTEGLAAARAAGHGINEAEFEMRLGEALYMRGELREAADVLERGLARFRDLGYAVGEASALTNLGSVRNREGDLAEAARLHLEALALCRRLGDAYRIADALNRAGNDRYAQGMLRSALELHRESLVEYEKIGHRFGVGVASYGIAADLLGLGAPADAEPLYRVALEVYGELGNRMYQAEALRGIAETWIARGDLDAARSHLERALEHLAAQPSPETMRNVRLLLARVDLEAGRPGDAEREMRRFLSASGVELDADGEGAARELLSQALLEQRRLEEARAAIRAAIAVTERSQRRLLRLGIEITAARIEAVSGEAATATSALLTVIERARELGLVSRRLEAELALARIRLRSGESAGAGRALGEIGREAMAHGFGLLAHKASTAEADLRRREPA